MAYLNCPGLIRVTRQPERGQRKEKRLQGKSRQRQRWDGELQETPVCPAGHRQGSSEPTGSPGHPSAGGFAARPAFGKNLAGIRKPHEGAEPPLKFSSRCEAAQEGGCPSSLRREEGAGPSAHSFCHLTPMTNRTRQLPPRCPGGEHPGLTTHRRCRREPPWSRSLLQGLCPAHPGRVSAAASEQHGQARLSHPLLHAHAPGRPCGSHGSRAGREGSKA